MFSLFHAPRQYPAVYQPYYDSFNFYEGREQWLESISDIPRKATLLFSLHWLHLEVYNGGFWQYFANSTSTSYPEAHEGFMAIGMPEVASVISSAADELGGDFPFDRQQRTSIVGPPNNRLDFRQHDESFYALADTEAFFRRRPKFVPFADEYARNA